MWLYLVHHGDAVGPGVDPQRPLSSDGSTRVDRLAGEVAARGVTPALIWHSGKLRARQTAHAFWRACNARAQMAAARGLQPTDPPDRVGDQLEAEALAEQQRDVMLVGHLPNLERVLCLLLDGTSDGGAAFPPHGIVAIERTDQRWVERWRLDG